MAVLLAGWPGGWAIARSPDSIVCEEVGAGAEAPVIEGGRREAESGVQAADEKYFLSYPVTSVSMGSFIYFLSFSLFLKKWSFGWQNHFMTFLTD